MLLLLCIFTSSVSCGHRLGVFHAIEQYVESSPDSALRVLSAMDTSTFHGREKAFHTYLTSLARYKAYIDEYEDAPISRAADYFRQHGDKERLMKSLYLKGYTQYCARNYDLAVITLTEAKSLAENLGDDFYAGLCCREMANSFESTFSAHSFLSNILDAYRFFEKTGQHERHVSYTLWQIGDAYLQNGDKVASKEYYDRANQRAIATADTSLMRLVSTSYIRYYTLSNQYDNAIQVGQMMVDSLHHSLACRELAYLARAYACVGQRDESSRLFSAAESLASNSLDHYTINYQHYQSALVQSDSTNALRQVQKVLSYVTGDEFLQQENSGLKAQRDYLEECRKTESLKKELSQQRLYTTVLMLFLIVLLLGTLLWRSYRWFTRRKKQMQLEKASLVEEIQTMAARKSEDLKKTTQSGMSFFNMFVQLYWQNQSHKIVPQMQELLKNLLSDDEVSHQLIRTLNETRNQLMYRLMEQVPSLNEKDIRLYYFLASQFEHNTICAILGKTPGALNAQIYRMRNKIEASRASDRLEFLEVIS